jgi:hypothetical protein
MREITKYSDLFNYLNKRVKIELQTVGEEVEKIIHNYVMEKLYKAYKPSNYIRTYEFLNSLRCSKVKENTDGSYSVSIYFDSNYIYPHKTEEGIWNQHMSTLGSQAGQDVSDMIVYWLETGDNKSGFAREKIGMFENAEKVLKETRFHIKKLMELLKARGFHVEW